MSENDPTTGDVDVTRDVVFRETPERILELDCYRPADPGRERDTAAVLVHGGGWRIAERWHLDGYAERLAARGFPAVTLDHRASDEATYPGPVTDVKAAIQWVRRHTDAWDASPERVLLLGASSGGHLAALAGVRPDHPGLDPDAPESTAVDGVVALNAPCDLVQRGRRGEGAGDPDSAPAEFVGEPFGTATERYREASPITHVTGESPPFLLLHGTEDEVVALDQSVRMASALRSAGVFCHLDAVAGAGHGFAIETEWRERALGEVELFAAFLDQGAVRRL